MLDNAVHGHEHAPSVRAEYEALRVAGGDGPGENPGDGSNPVQVMNGIIRRYGWSPVRIPVPGSTTNFEELWDRFDPGWGAVWPGRMGALSTHYRRWDTSFTGPHSSYAQREDAKPRAWWMNPLAPKNYAGEYISKEDLKRYWQSFPTIVLFGEIGSLALPDTSTEDDVTTVTIKEWPSQRRFATNGATLRRFSETGELSAIPGPYSASADADVAISGNPGAPTGLGFLRLASGGSAGRFILASQVTLEPAIPGDCSGAIAADRKAARVVWE